MTPLLKQAYHFPIWLALPSGIIKWGFRKCRVWGQEDALDAAAFQRNFFRSFHTIKRDYGFMRKNKNYLERQNISENTKDALSPLIENKRKMRRMETILIWVVLIIGLIGALAMLWMYLGSRWG